MPLGMSDDSRGAINQQVTVVILGGGRGTRLDPLTRDRSKPAVPLAGNYRLIDVPISNALNSELIGTTLVPIALSANQCAINAGRLSSIRPTRWPPP